MATTTAVIALGTTANRVTASPVTIDAGQVKTVGIFAATGFSIPGDCYAWVGQVMPAGGEPIVYARLSGERPGVSLTSPGDYHIYISTVGAAGIQIGAFQAV